LSPVFRTYASIASSSRTLVILSPSFLKSRFCHADFFAALSSGKMLVVMRTNEQQKPLVTDDDLQNFRVISKHIKMFTVLKEGANDIKPFFHYDN
jgi:hypothetical protein